MKHILVCPFDTELISCLEGVAVVIATDNAACISDIRYVVEERNHLHCISLTGIECVSDIPLCEEWRDVPMHITAHRLGSLRGIRVMLPLLRSLPIRVFLPVDTRDNMIALQILASLHVHCGAVLPESGTDWDAFTDLLHFALYPRVQRATIEPFYYIVREYAATQQTDYSTVYFNNPKRYLHMSLDGRIAMCSTDCERGRFIGRIDANLVDNTLFPPAVAFDSHMQELFLKDTGCAFCEAWRICGGKYYTTAMGSGCAAAHIALMDAVEDFIGATRNASKVSLCRP